MDIPDTGCSTSHTYTTPCLCTCLERSLGRQAPKLLYSVISLQTYAVCQRKLAPAWPTFDAGGIIRKLRRAPDSSMEVAKGTITTSNLNQSARASAPKNVSPRGPSLLGSPGPHGEVWVLADLFQELGRFGADINNPIRR